MEKAQRYRAAEEAKRVIKPDANDPFVFKRPRQHQAQTPNAAQQQQQPASTPTAAPASSPSSAAPASSPSNTRDESDSKYPSSSPSSSSAAAASAKSPASAAVPSSNQTLVLCSVLVELFEMKPGSGHPSPIAFGPKGVTFQRLPQQPGAEPSYQLLVYAPVSKKVEFTVEVNDSFQFAVLPDRFASFDDAARGRSWCIKFGSSEDAYMMARCMGFMQVARAMGVMRSVIIQELAVGAPDGSPPVNINDQLRAKFTIYAYDPVASPYQLGTPLYSMKESAKFICGAGSMGLSAYVEGTLVGMRKKGCRLLILPPGIANGMNENASWSVHVTPNTALAVEVSVSNVRASVPVEDEQFTEQQDQQQQQQDEPLMSPQSEPASSPANASAVPSEDDRGVYNPTSIPAQATDLKSRMALLAGAQRENGVVPPAAGGVGAAQQAGASPGTTAASASTRRESLLQAAHAPNPSVDSTSSSTSASSSSSSSEPTIESLLASLSLSSLLPNFQKEGVTYADLFHLDADELKQMVPIMGPRRRLAGRLQELNEQKEAEELERRMQQQQQQTSQRAGLHVTTSTPSAAHHSSASTAAASSGGLFSPFTPTLTAAAQPTTAQSNTAARLRGFEQMGQALPGLTGKPATTAATPPSATTRGSSRSTSSSDAIVDEPPTSSSAVGSAKHLSQIHSQSQLEALLSSEYSRGQNETILLAKNKIEAMKETAQGRFQELQMEVQQAKERNEADRATAREMVQRLKKEVEARQSRCCAKAR